MLLQSDVLLLDAVPWLLSNHSCWPIRCLWTSIRAGEGSVTALTPGWSGPRAMLSRFFPWPWETTCLEAGPSELGALPLARILHLLNTSICSNLFSECSVYSGNANQPAKRFLSPVPISKGASCSQGGETAVGKGRLLTRDLLRHGCLFLLSSHVSSRLFPPHL